MYLNNYFHIFPKKCLFAIRHAATNAFGNKLASRVDGHLQAPLMPSIKDSQNGFPMSSSSPV